MPLAVLLHKADAVVSLVIKLCLDVQNCRILRQKVRFMPLAVDVALGWINRSFVHQGSSYVFQCLDLFFPCSLTMCLTLGSGMYSPD